MKKIIFIIIILAIAIISGLFLLPKKGAAPSSDAGAPDNSGNSEPNIVVFSSKPHDIVGEKIKVIGKARVFENQFNIRIVFEGKKIYETGAMTDAPDAGVFGNFEKEIDISSFGIKDGSALELEVFNYSVKDGSEIDKVAVPLKFRQSETIEVNVYFNSGKMDPEYSCNKVFAVKRKIPKTQAVGKAALEELLRGPTDEEKSQGFLTSINSGVKIQNLTIENGVARVDFDEQLEYQVGGSCRVSAIRAQITQTLLQFSAVQNVIISINGRTEDILQP